MFFFYFFKLKIVITMGKRSFVSSIANVSEVTFANVMKVNKTRDVLLFHLWFKIYLRASKITWCKSCAIELNMQLKTKSGTVKEISNRKSNN